MPSLKYPATSRCSCKSLIYVSVPLEGQKARRDRGGGTIPKLPLPGAWDWSDSSPGRRRWRSCWFRTPVFGVAALPTWLTLDKPPGWVSPNRYGRVRLWKRNLISVKVSEAQLTQPHQTRRASRFG